jgi:hypothetical protein
MMPRSWHSRWMVCAVEAYRLVSPVEIFWCG